jgi:hypothetical protein
MGIALVGGQYCVCWHASPLVINLALAPLVPAWWAIVGIAPLVMEYQWQADLLCPGGELEEEFHLIFELLECVQWKH